MYVFPKKNSLPFPPCEFILRKISCGLNKSSVNLACRQGKSLDERAKIKAGVPLHP